MTDTTKERNLEVAIDSLKHSCLRLNKYQHRATVDIEDVELVLTTLEAERQRSDHNKVMQLAAEDVSASALRDWSGEGIKLQAATEEIKRLTAEIAALKGDQVPVEYQMYYHNHGTGGGEWCRVRTKARYEELQIEHAGDNDFSFRTLFTAPQKPVVLLPKFTDRHTCINAGCDAASAYKEDVIAMNKAAGGIVKDGE